MDNKLEDEDIKHPIIKPKRTKFQKFCRKWQMFLLDRPVLKSVLNWIMIILVTILSAICFSFGYRAFIAPGTYQGLSIPSLISGGASGVSQVILKLIELCGYIPEQEKDLQSLLYLLVNIPLFIVAWIFIGKKFTLVTILNVALTSLFIKILPDSWVTVFNSIPEVKDRATSTEIIIINTVISGAPFQYDYLARAITAGVTTGVSVGLSYLIGTSAGGTDIIAFSIAEKKSSNVGKYTVIINCIIVILYTTLNSLRLSKQGENGLAEMPMVIYTIVYFLVSSKVTDLINIKNKKTELQINTQQEDLASKLMCAFPHGCTIVHAIGGYTNQPRKIIYMVVSAFEVKKVVRFAKENDPSCFVNVIHSHQVVGNFYIQPLK